MQKVVFNLHETFDNPTRVLTTPPFCVKENGYGEFELPIDIFFHGSNEKYSLNYFLKLPPLNTSLPLSKLRREIITFINPCADFRRKLIEGGASVQPLTSSDAVAAYTNGGTHGSTKPVKTSFSSLSSPSSSLLSNHQLILNASIDANNHENNSLIKSSSKKKHSLNSSGLVANVSTVKQPQKLNNSTTNPNGNNVSSSKSIKNSHTSNDSTPNNNNNNNSNNSKLNANNSNGKVPTINNNHNNITSNDSAVKKTFTNKKVRHFVENSLE